MSLLQHACRAKPVEMPCLWCNTHAAASLLRCCVFVATRSPRLQVLLQSGADGGGLSRMLRAGVTASVAVAPLPDTSAAAALPAAAAADGPVATANSGDASSHTLRVRCFSVLPQHSVCRLPLIK